MADDSRPRPPILKRFANLDIDGVGLVRQKPVKDQAPVATAPIVTRSQTPRAAPSAELPSPSRRPEMPRRDTSPMVDPDLLALERLGTEINDNAQVSRQNATPQARRTARAAELRAMRPPDPRPARAQPQQDRYQPERLDRRQVSAEDLELDLPAELMTGGVVTVEVDLSRGRRGLEMRFETRQMPGQQMPGPEGPLWELPRTTPPAWAERARSQPGVNAFTDTRRADPPRAARVGEPIELTPMAARQIQLMAWEAGVPGSPLRILTSNTPGLGHPEIDFAFDEDIAPDDIVVDALGVTVIIDPQSLVWVRGRRITWHDVPGSEGFSLR